MESKYGRLFTDADVASIVDEVLCMTGTSWGLASVAETTDEAIRRASVDLSKDGLTFPPDEPLFVLRGSDLAAPDAIGAYFDVCSGYGDPIQEGECSDAYCDSIATAGEKIEAWQREHPDRVKVPG